MSGLKNRLLDPDLIAEYVRAYQAAFNQLSGTIRADRLADIRELAKVILQIDQMVNTIAKDMFHPGMKDKMRALESSKTAFTAKLRDAADAAPGCCTPDCRLLPGPQVRNLTAALQSDSTKAVPR